MTTYRCKRCNYLYIDEEKEIPFEELDNDYRCLKCGSPKALFVKKANT